MPAAPLQFLLLLFAGWVNRRQHAVIAYLREENRVLREQLGLENQLITKSATPANDNSPVLRRERLGGLLNFYYRRAS